MYISDKKTMFMRALTFSFFLAVSLSLKAEESNIWDDFISFFSSGDNQGKECDEESVSQELAEQIRSEVCPHFLMNQVMSRDQQTMIFSKTSAEKLCYENASRRDDYVFKTPQELENYLRSKEPFSKINTVPTADCLSHPVSTGFWESEKTLPEDKRKAVLAEYYLTQQRLESGMSGVLQDITAIDQLIGSPPLNEINCNKFQLTSNILEECQSLQQCSPSESSLNPLAKETVEAMRAITAIEERIDKLEGPRNRWAKKNAVQIQELRERKASLQSLYPWTAGKIFLDQYDEKASEEKTAQLIKEQLSYTRKKLEKNINEMQRAVSCIRYNRKCEEVEYDKVMGKTPMLSYEDIDSIFQVGKASRTKLMSESELDSLSDEERKKLSEEMSINGTAAGYMTEAQCRQNTRESVSEARKELGFLALDVGLTIATVGLGSAAIAGRLAIRAGSQISKAQRLKNLGLMGVDISFSAPYINKAIDDCDEYMNQLEQKAGEETNDICKKLPVRAQLKSDLTSCLLTASLASLPLAVPAFAVAGRAGFKVLKPSMPKNPTSPASTLQEIKNSAEMVLGKDLSEEQVQVILYAHRIGDGEIGKDLVSPAEIGNYTAKHIREKVKVLADAGFSQDDRSALIRNGIVGKRRKKSGKPLNQSQSQLGKSPSISEKITPANIVEHLSNPEFPIKVSKEFMAQLRTSLGSTTEVLPEILSERINKILIDGRVNFQNLKPAGKKSPGDFKKLSGDVWEFKWSGERPGKRKPGVQRVYYTMHDGALYLLHYNPKNHSRQQNTDIRAAQNVWNSIKRSLEQGNATGQWNAGRTNRAGRRR